MSDYGLAKTSNSLITPGYYGVRSKAVPQLLQIHTRRLCVFLNGDTAEKTMKIKQQEGPNWLRPLHRQNWVVYLKRPFGGPEYVVHYLGRYTHRVAISNHRLVSFADGKVIFRWRNSAHHNEQKLLTLSSDEFLRRFLLHILPKGFVRIRNFGFLANRKRATLLPLCLHLVGATQPPLAQQHASGAKDPQSWCAPNAVNQ